MTRAVSTQLAGEGAEAEATDESAAVAGGELHLSVKQQAAVRNSQAKGRMCISTRSEKVGKMSIFAGRLMFSLFAHS